MTEVLRNAGDPTGRERADACSTKRLEDYILALYNAAVAASEVGLPAQALDLQAEAARIQRVIRAIRQAEALRKGLSSGQGVHGEAPSKAEITAAVRYGAEAVAQYPELADWWV